MEVDNNKIIHLYMLDECKHKCKFCCNKQYDCSAIPVVTVGELKYADTVCLTGGEPFLLDNVCDFAEKIKTQYPNIKTIYVYSCGDSLYDWLNKNGRLHHIDGVNLSPKNKYDVECVAKIFESDYFREQILSLWSNRIYLFPNVIEEWNKYDTLRFLNDYESVNVLKREWQEQFVAASGIFRRLPILFG